MGENTRLGSQTVTIAGRTRGSPETELRSLAPIGRLGRLPFLVIIPSVHAAEATRPIDLSKLSGLRI